MKKHANIPLFVVHMGCPNQCVFCNQRLISGTSSFSADNAEEQIERALTTLSGTGRQAEIAFFGGSFTGIERSLMVGLLDTAQKYVEQGYVSGIRMSTRPDYIDADILAILSRYTVSCVELGIQSMSDSVLRITKRGHTAEDTRRACRLLTESGIPFAGQMMLAYREHPRRMNCIAPGKLPAWAPWRIGYIRRSCSAIRSWRRCTRGENIIPCPWRKRWTV